MTVGSFVKGFIALAVVGGIGFAVYKKSEEKAKKTAEQSAASASSINKSSSTGVTAYIVEARKLADEIDITGTLVANEDVEIRPEIAGRLTMINTKEGVNVAKGTLLAKLFDADLRAQLAKLQSQLIIADKNEQRLKQLLAINGVSQQEYDAGLNQVNNIKADMEVTRVQLSKTEIHAPFAGTLGLRLVSEGAYVSPTNILVKLQQINPIKLDFNVPEKYRNFLKVGETISFMVDGNEAKNIGKVYTIEPQIDLNTRTVKMRALCQNTNGKLYPGAFAKVKLSIKDNQNALMVPTQAIIPEARVKKLLLVKNGKAKSQIVETGVRNEEYIQVLSGVQVGDTVVTTGIMQLRPDALVKITNIIK